MAFAAGDSREGSGSVDQRDNGAAGLFGQLHEPERLSISLGFRAAEVVFEVLLQIVSLPDEDDHDGPSLEPRKSAADRPVVTEAPVTVELHEIGEDHPAEILRMGSQGVPRQADLLPGSQVLLEELLDLLDLLEEFLQL